MGGDVSVSPQDKALVFCHRNALDYGDSYTILLYLRENANDWKGGSQHEQEDD